MYRTNAQSRPVEERFVRRGIPYRLVGGTRFYERREVKDLLAYLRLVQNPFDSVALMRVINMPGRGIGDRTLAELNRLGPRDGRSALRRAPDGRRLRTRLARVPSAHPEEPIGLRSEVPSAIEGRSPRATTFQKRTVGALLRFLGLLNELIALAKTARSPSSLDAVIDRIDYKPHIMSDPDGEERWENVQELRNRRCPVRRAEAGARPCLVPRGRRPDHRRRRVRREGRLRHADHPARRQRPRVPRRLHHRHGGGHPAAHALARERQPGAARGRAPPLLRRHDPRQAPPLPGAGLPARVQRPQPASRFLTDIPELIAQSQRATQRDMMPARYRYGTHAGTVGARLGAPLATKAARRSPSRPSPPATTSATRSSARASSSPASRQAGTTRSSSPSRARRGSRSCC